MDFSQELSQFPSEVHRVIYDAARYLTPLSVSLEGMEDAALRASCEQYYGFVQAMLSDMYDHPEAYHLPVMALEDFCAGKKVNGMKRKYPAKTKSLLAQTHNVVSGYMKTLCMLGMLGTVQGDTLCIPDDAMPLIRRRVQTSVSPISPEKRLQALERVGLVWQDTCFVSTQFPGMLPALSALTARLDKLSGFDYFAFTNAEFRNIGAKYKPTVDDYFRPLPAAMRERAYALHAFAIANKLTPQINTFWKVDYKYKGAQALCIGSEGKLDVRVTCSYLWDGHDMTNELLALLPEAIQRDAQRHVWRCEACSTTHLGHFVTIMGRRQRVCGGGLIGFRWYNPGEADMGTIQALIRVRMEVANALKKAAKDKTTA